MTDLSSTYRKETNFPWVSPKIRSRRSCYFDPTCGQNWDKPQTTRDDKKENISRDKESGNNFRERITNKKYKVSGRANSDVEENSGISRLEFVSRMKSSSGKTPTRFDRIARYFGNKVSCFGRNSIRSKNTSSEDYSSADERLLCNEDQDIGSGKNAVPGHLPSSVRPSETSPRPKEERVSTRFDERSTGSSALSRTYGLYDPDRFTSNQNGISNVVERNNRHSGIIPLSFDSHSAVVTSDVKKVTHFAADFSNDRDTKYNKKCAIPVPPPKPPRDYNNDTCYRPLSTREPIHSSFIDGNESRCIRQHGIGLKESKMEIVHFPKPARVYYCESDYRPLSVQGSAFISRQGENGHPHRPGAAPRGPDLELVPPLKPARTYPERAKTHHHDSVRLYLSIPKRSLASPARSRPPVGVVGLAGVVKRTPEHFKTVTNPVLLRQSEQLDGLEHSRPPNPGWGRVPAVKVRPLCARNLMRAFDAADDGLSTAV